MRLSIGKDNKIFNKYIVNGKLALEHVITKKTYSFGIFAGSHRTAKNFKFADAVGLDFDGGYPLKQAIKDFKDYKCVIAPTRSHQKNKNGVVDDRFRVILFLSKPIMNTTTYHNTIKSLLKQFPKADRACKDPSRMFYPSIGVTLHNTDGKLIEPVHSHIELVRDDSATAQDVSELDFNKIPPGFTKCKWSIANGFFESGEGNEALMSLVTTCKKIGYTKEQAYYMAKNALRQRELRTGAVADKDSLWREVVETVYSPQWTGAKYVCSKEGTWLHDYCLKLEDHGCEKSAGPFNLMTVDGLMKTEDNLDWLVDGLLSRGGFSLMSGAPKSGKSTLTRQLAKSVSRGEEFLGREVHKGTVLYLALEEQVSMFKDQFKKLGITKDDNILIHIGDIASIDPYAEVRKLVEEQEPDLVVVDTLLLLGKIENANDYTTVNNALKEVRMIARQTGTHIIGVHHTNKGEGGGTKKIMGSVAIHGAVDNAIMLEHREMSGRRFINSSQRGGRPFDNRELDFNKDNLHYNLKPVGIGDDEF